MLVGILASSRLVLVEKGLNKKLNLFAPQFFQPQIRESIRPRDVKDWSHHKEDREPVPMTFIPFENIARYMDKSDIETNFRQSFYDYLKLLESEFEKYIAETDLNRMSLNNFFHAYLGAQTQTKIRLGKEDVKSDFGFVCVPGKVGPGK